MLMKNLLSDKLKKTNVLMTGSVLIKYGKGLVLSSNIQNEFEYRSRSHQWNRGTLNQKYDQHCVVMRMEY